MEPISLKTIKKRNKFKREIILSLFLHAILLFTLTLHSFKQETKISSNRSLPKTRIVMVDSRTNMVQNFNPYQKQKISEPHVERKFLKEIKQQVENSYKNRIPEQRNLNQIDKRHLQIQESISSKKEKNKGSKEIVKKIKDQKFKNKEIKKETKGKVNINDINRLDRNLSLGDNIQETNVQSKTHDASISKNSNIGSNTIIDSDIRNYAGQIKSAIEKQFYNSSFYSGKICTLRIKLAPDGMLIDVQPENGDPALCFAALSAAKQARIPTPPSREVYEVFKRTMIDFKP